jgi:hypothetical protein
MGAPVVYNSELGKLLPFLTPTESAEIDRLASKAEIDFTTWTDEALDLFIGDRESPEWIKNLTDEELYALINTR